MKRKVKLGKVKLGSVPTFEEAERVFREVVDIYSQKTYSYGLKLEVVRRKRHIGYVKWVDYDDFKWDRVKIKTTFPDFLGIKNWGYYIAVYDKKTGQISNYGREIKQEPKTEKQKIIGKLRNDINNRLLRIRIACVR